MSQEPPNEHSSRDSDDDPISDLTMLVSFSGHCSYLLTALIVMLFIYPFLQGSFYAQGGLGLVNTALILAGAFASGTSRRTLGIAFLLTIPTLTLHWVAVLTDSRTLDIAYLIALIGFYTFTISRLLVYVLKRGPISVNKLHGALSTYILMALLWTALYGLADLTSDGAFNVNGSVNTQPVPATQLMFFSFTTLTSTGYGDVVPAAPYTQSLSILEQLLGVFFVAVLIARVAGLYPADMRQR